MNINHHYSFNDYINIMYFNKILNLISTTITTTTKIYTSTPQTKQNIEIKKKNCDS